MDIPVPSDYVPSEGELNNLAYLYMSHTIDWPMRHVDFQVCRMMAGQVIGPDGIENFIDIVCEYIWDHLLGEPDECSPEVLKAHLADNIIDWYKKTTPELRSMI